MFVWFSISFYTTSPLWNTEKNAEHLMEELIQANQEIEYLRSKMKEMSQKYKQRHVILDSQYLKKNDGEYSQKPVPPSMEYELTRRRLYRDINEYWWYIQGFLENTLSFF